MVGLIIFLTGLPIAYYAAKYNIDSTIWTMRLPLAIGALPFIELEIGKERSPIASRQQVFTSSKEKQRASICAKNAAKTSAVTIEVEDPLKRF